MNAHLNLLPMRYRRRQLIHRRVRQWSVTWLLAVACMAFGGWAQWSRFQDSASRLASLRERCQPIEAMRGEVATLHQQIDALKRQQALALSLTDERSMLGLVGLLSQARHATSGRIAIGQLSLVRTGDNQAATNVLTLSGVAVDDIAVASFVAALRAADAFVTIDLTSTTNTTVESREARAYTLQCTF